MDHATLVAAAVGGDRAAWSTIYDREADGLHDHCWSILRDDHEAAVALHDTFVAAGRTLPHLRDRSRLRPWLFALARAEAGRRHRARPQTGPTDGIGELGTVAVDLEPGSGSPIDDLRHLVWDAAGGLSTDDLALLDLDLRQGLGGQDLAEAMGLPAGRTEATRSQLHGSVDRSLGALLVARTGRGGCPTLAEILTGWDGQATPLRREQVAGHIDGCDACGERRRSMVSPLDLVAGVPRVPAPPEARDRILIDTVAASVSAPQPADSLFPVPAAAPPASPPAGRPPARGADGGTPWGWILAGVAAAILLVIGVLVAITGGDDEGAGSGDTTTSSTASTTSSSSTSSTSSTSTSTSSTTSTTRPGTVALSTTDVDLGAGATSGRFRVTNGGGAPISYTLTTSRFLGINRRTGTLQPGAAHTIVVTLDRSETGAPEGAFAGTVRLDAGAAGTGAVGVTATITARPPVIDDDGVTTSEPAVYFDPSCPLTEALVTFTDQSAVTQGFLRFQSATIPDDVVELTFDGNRATAPFPRPPSADTEETVTYTVTLTDSLGASVTSEPQEIETLETCS